MTSTRVFLNLVLVVLAFSAYAQKSVTSEVLSRSSDSFVLTAIQPSVSQSIVIDRSPRADIMVSALSSDLDVTLISPKKTRYSFGQSRPDFESFVSVREGFGANYRAIITNPASGTWTVVVTGKKVAVDVPVVIQTFLQSAVFTAIAAGGIEHRVGDFAAVSLATFDGSARVRGVNVVATLLGPGETRTAVPFRDDGAEADLEANDGIYTALVELAREGEYEIKADVRGVASANEFRRTAAATLRARKATATLTGTFIDAAVDDDDDDLFDAITISPAVAVAEAGSYLVTVTLRSTSRETIQKTSVIDLATGTANPVVRFEADRIKDHLAQDGPYTVQSILLERHELKDVVFVDERSEVGLTGLYRLEDLQRERVRLAGPLIATGVDRNENGLFDELTVEVGLETELDGMYSFSGSLSSSGGHLGLASRQTELEAGTHTIILTFEGGPIGSQSVNGPYDVHVTADGPASTDAYFKTAALTASRFEGFVPDTTPPALTVTVSPSVLWPPDQRMIEITPSIRVSDDRDPSPFVVIESITSDEGQDWRPYGTASSDIKVEAGRIFLRAQRSGTGQGRHYLLTWAARDVQGNNVKSEAMVTVPHDQGD